MGKVAFLQKKGCRKTAPKKAGRPVVAVPLVMCADRYFRTVWLPGLSAKAK